MSNILAGFFIPLRYSNYIGTNRQSSRMTSCFDINFNASVLIFTNSTTFIVQNPIFMFNFAPASQLLGTTIYNHCHLSVQGIQSPGCSDGNIRTDKKVKRFIKVGGFFYLSPFSFLIGSATST